MKRIKRLKRRKYKRREIKEKRKSGKARRELNIIRDRIPKFPKLY